GLGQAPHDRTANRGAAWLAPAVGVRELVPRTSRLPARAAGRQSGQGPQGTRGAGAGRCENRRLATRTVAALVRCGAPANAGRFR
ncbi:hypothetical protein DF186_19510, partial [Enterococcus hirae]